MLRVLLVSRAMDTLARFTAGLRQDRHTELTLVDSAAAATDVIGKEQVDLVIVGEELTDTGPVDCVTQMVRCNPMINYAVISGMEHDAFHEATEGLGILMQLPPLPSGEDAAVLLAKVDAISVQLSGMVGREDMK